MPRVDVTVAGRSYALGCEDGQETHLRALAAAVDGEARKIAADLGSVGEARLLLMAALMLADRLSEAGTAAPAADGAALADAAERVEALLAAETTRDGDG